jgi:hypothetical protein
MKEELKEIERLTILNGGTKSFDTWGCSVRSMLYFFLINEFKEKGINFFRGKHDSYIVFFLRGHYSKGGMDMGSPDSMVIQRINEYI